jgi:hypothetical protein
VTWLAEFPVTWVFDGKRVPGRIALGMPELVPDDGENEEGAREGEAMLTVALDGLQPRTTVHGEGKFHVLLLAIRFLETRLRDHASKGVRVVIYDDEDDTDHLLAMFKRFDLSD